MKKFTSIILSVILVLSIFSVISITANATSKTAQEAVDWACAQIGNSIDGAYGCQCVDLIMKYYDILGVRRVSGNGCDYINNALPENEWYRTATPSVGDVVVWGVNVDIAREYGHVGIVVNVNGGYIDYVDQNSWEYGAKVGRHNGYLASKASTYIHPAFSGNPNPTPTGSKTISDGDYFVTSALDNNKVLDIDDESISNNKANAQLWSLLKETNQIFSIRHIGDGYYNIICKKSGKYLEVEGGYKDIGTNVQQYDSNGTDAQQWVIKETGDGYYNIVSKCNGLCLDVDNSNTANGTNVKVYTENSSEAQKWQFVLLGTKNFIDGDYFIASAIDNNKVLDIDDGNVSKDKANAQLWDFLNGTNQIFSIKHIGSGYYSISCKKSGKYLEVEGGKASPGVNVQQYDGNGTDAQQWVIKETEDNYYHIISKRNGLYLDVDNGETANGTNIKVYSGDSFDAQKWRLIPLGTQTIKDDDYYIASALDNNKVLDIDDESISNNKANAQLWSLLKGTNQVFSIKYNNNGYYSIICKKSDKYLEVEGGYTDIGTNVQQYDGNGTDAQQWVIKENGDGYYYIVSKCNGLYLDVDNGKTDNGTNIKAYLGHLDNAQKWKFIKVEDNTVSYPSEPTGIQIATYELTQSTETQLITDKSTEPTTTQPVTNVSTEPNETVVQSTEGSTTEPVIEKTTEPQQSTSEPVEATATEPTASGNIPTEPSETADILTETTPTANAPTEPPTTESVIDKPTEPTQPTTDKPENTVVEKKANPVKVTAKTKTVKIKKLKSKNQTVKPLTVKNAKGTVNISKVKTNAIKKIYSKITVNKNTGAITFKKGKYAKKTYSITLKINVKGNKDYKSKTITKTVKVKVK